MKTIMSCTTFKALYQQLPITPKSPGTSYLLTRLAKDLIHLKNLTCLKADYRSLQYLGEKGPNRVCSYNK